MPFSRSPSLNLLPGFTLLFSLATSSPLAGHEPHSAPTYSISAARDPRPDRQHLEIQILDETTGQALPARFSLECDGTPYVPPALSTGGIRFTSVHTAKKQRQTMLYTRGTEPVRFELPDETSEVRIFATRGYDYLPRKETIRLKPGLTNLSLSLRRWIDPASQNWHAADEHLHYERIARKHDRDWATLLEADGLHQGFFLVLKGGNLPGIWAQQYAYGAEGTGTVGKRLLIPGEEFRGSAQGHNNLLGLEKVLAPISVGGMGSPPHRPNWPPMHDILLATSRSGGIGGPAHGGTFGKASTVYLDALLGASQFMEVANTHLYELEPWYLLLNCGVNLPPVAGTDLPNFPFRDSWQPFFGETRTYVQVENPTSFAAWKSALRNRKVYVSSGPFLDWKVTPAPLQNGERNVIIEAHISSPRPLQSLEIIQNGQPLPVLPQPSVRDGIHYLELKTSVSLRTSSWFAARGQGVRKSSLWAGSGHLQHTMVHSSATEVRVDDRPVRIENSLHHLRAELAGQQTWYRQHGTFPDAESRQRMLRLFDQALERLEP